MKAESMGAVVSRPLDHRYMQVVIVQGAEGAQYPCAETAPAVVVLPWRQAPAGPVIYLLEQSRSEMKDVKVLKTVGGYIAVQESPVDAMIRNLAAKVGLHVGADKLELINEPLGYPVLYAPISIFRWKVDNKPQAKCSAGLRLIEIALVEALRMVRQRLLFDASTSEPIVDLAIDLGFFA